MDADYYRRRAAELDEVAERFDRPEHQDDYRRMAESWRQLADRLDAAEALDPGAGFPG